MMVCRGSFVFQLKTQAEFGTQCCNDPPRAEAADSDRDMDKVLGPEESDWADFRESVGLSGRLG